MAIDMQAIRQHLEAPVKSVWDKLPLETKLAVKVAADEGSKLMLRVAQHGPESLNPEERVYLEATAANLMAIGLNRKTGMDLIEAVGKALLKIAVGVKW